MDPMTLAGVGLVLSAVDMVSQGVKGAVNKRKTKRQNALLSAQRKIDDETDRLRESKRYGASPVRRQWNQHVDKEIASNTAKSQALSASINEIERKKW